MITELPKGTKQWHRRLWEQNANRYNFFELAQHIKPDITLRQWEHACEFCTLLACTHKQAVTEFLMAINGTY